MQFVTELAAPWSRDLTTLDRVKVAAAGPAVAEGQPSQGLKLPPDDEVSRLITAASAMIESYIHRTSQLLETTYREYIAGDGGPILLLTVTPVISVSSITLRGQALTEDWTVDPNTGKVFRQQGWEFTGQVWRDIEDTRLPQPGKPDFVVDYFAGYSTQAQNPGFATLPADIEQACILTVMQWAQTQNRDLTIQRTRIGDFTQTFFSGVSNIGGVRGLPTPVQDMLAPYRRVV